MPRKESLPMGMDRLPSGSLRIRLRVSGFHPITRTFPLFSDSAEERRRQMADAKSWAEETRRQMLGGVYVSTREAENITLGEALRRYEREGLIGKASNAAKDRSRIRLILADPISRRPVAGLRKTDIAAYRDALIRSGWRKNVDAAIRRLDDKGDSHSRVEDLRSLEKLRAEAASAEPDERARLEACVKVVEAREGIKEPARTTVANRLQLITRALKHIGQTIDGVPDLKGVAMPKASPGRERRVSSEELAKLLHEAANINPTLPLIIRFAIETALRRERVLTVTFANIRDIGGGKRAIVFPRETAVRNKRTGIIPVTREIQSIVENAVAAADNTGRTVVHPRADDKYPIFGVSEAIFVNWWKRLLKATAIPDLHFHDLRHEATSRLFERGLTTAEVMSITGHSTNDMIDRYSHYSAARVQEKLERGLDPTAILDEIAFLMDQYKALSGDVKKVEALWEAKK